MHSIQQPKYSQCHNPEDCLLTFKVTLPSDGIMYKKGKSFLNTFSFLNYRSKYFRGKRIHGDYDIRVEQAEFKELSVNCNTEGGVTASIILAKSGNKVVRSFKPDFLLVRQNVRDTDEDHRNILLGFQYGNLPSVNTLDSIYNFQVRNEKTCCRLQNQLSVVAKKKISCSFQTLRCLSA